MPQGHAAASLPPEASAAAARRARQGWWLGLLAVVVFAGSIPMTRLASGAAAGSPGAHSLPPQLAPEFVAMGRAAVAGLLAAAHLAWVGAPWPRAAQWRLLAASAAGVVFGWPLLLGWAVQRVEAVHAAMVAGLLPIATAAFGVLAWRQRPGWRFWVASGAGTALILAYAGWRGGGAWRGADALLLGAVLASAFGYAQGARLTNRPPAGCAPMAPEQVIGWVLLLSLPLTLPWAWALRPRAPVAASAWAGLAYVSVLSMWLGFFAWYRAMAWGGAMRVSQIQMLQPFLSMLWAWPLLGETVDAPTLGFALAVLACVLLARRLAPPSTPAAAAVSLALPRNLP